MGDCTNAPVATNVNSTDNKNGDVKSNGKNGDFSEPKEEAKDDESNVQLNAR